MNDQVQRHFENMKKLMSCLIKFGIIVIIATAIIIIAGVLTPKYPYSVWPSLTAWFAVILNVIATIYLLTILYRFNKMPRL